MTTPAISIYAGDFPNRNDAQSKFSNDVGNFLPYFGTIGPEYNAMATWTNGQTVLAQQAVTDAQTEVDNAAGYANNSADSATESAGFAEMSSSAVNFKGAWASLTGALNVPSSVFHSGLYWQLINNLADVTASEPGVTADWVGFEMRLISASYIYTLGLLTQSTEVFQYGNSVTDFTYTDGALTQTINTYLSIVTTTTYTYTNDLLTGVTVS